MECIHFILLTKYLLEPRLALQIRVSSLVNPNGGQGANKPADMERENQVRDHITENVDVQIACKSFNTCHKSRPDIPDLQTLLRHIHQFQQF